MDEKIAMIDDLLDVTVNDVFQVIKTVDEVLTLNNFAQKAVIAALTNIIILQSTERSEEQFKEYLDAMLKIFITNKENS